MWWKRPIAIFSLITLALYFFSFFNQFVWDDEQFIYRNEYVRDFAVEKIFTTNTVAGAGELSNYYRPLTTLSFAIDYQFWQLNPFGYHIVNTLLHLGSGILIYYLLLKLKFNKQLSFVTALIFLVHPLQTEAVTYVNSRGDSLYTFFLTLSLLLHTYIFENKKRIFTIYNAHFEVKKVYIACAVVITYLASILSKEIALAGLGLQALIIFRYLFLEIENKKYFFKNWIHFFVDNCWSVISFMCNVIVVAVYLKLRSSALNFDNTFNFYSDHSVYSENVVVRLLTFLKIIFIYIKLIFIPYPLHMERNVSLVEHIINPWFFAFIALVSLLSWMSYWQWKKKQSLDILFGWAWLAVMLVPVSGVIAINGLMYEHWLYLPLVGFCIVFYGIIDLLKPELLKNKPTKYFFIAFACVFGLLTLLQNYYWSSPITLYTHLLKYTDSARIHNNLAMAYSDEGRRQEALGEYQKAIDYGMNYPQIYHNMGNTYRDMGDIANAKLSYQKALEVSPSFHFTYGNLAKIYIEEKDFDQAVAVMQLAEKYYPTVPDYDLLELQILQEAGNKKSFEEKKAFILKKYADNLQIINVANSLQLSK